MAAEALDPSDKQLLRSRQRAERQRKIDKSVAFGQKFNSNSIFIKSSHNFLHKIETHSIYHCTIYCEQIDAVVVLTLVEPKSDESRDHYLIQSILGAINNFVVRVYRKAVKPM